MARPKKKKSVSPFHRRPTTPPEELVYPVRLNKYVARCGICSRRAAVDLIKNGRVTVDRTVRVEPYYLVEENQVVRLDAKVIKPESVKVYYLLNKPKGIISTTSDEKGRATIMDVIKDKSGLRLFPIGRLDRNTTGLIVVTNDGDLAKKLSHPSHKTKKQYLISLDRPVAERDIRSIKDGVELEDGPVPIVDLQVRDNNSILLTIVIGRNRIVRRLFENFDYKVVKLDRVYYAGLTKKGLPRGKYRTLTAQEVIMLKHFT